MSTNESSSQTTTEAIIHRRHNLCIKGNGHTATPRINYDCNDHCHLHIPARQFCAEIDSSCGRVEFSARRESALSSWIRANNEREGPRAAQGYPVSWRPMEGV